MMSRFLIVLALAATACTPQPVADSSDAVQQQVARLWTADTRTVLSGDEARGLAHQCSRTSPGPVEGLWTPSTAQLDALEDQLILLLSRQLELAGESPSPGDYYRQYAGFVIGGRQVIYVNGVHTGAVQGMPRWAPNGDWTRDAISICDGGTITFGAEYDVATGRLSNFAFNGAI